MNLPFHEVTQRWFRERFGEPTDVQERAWPVIAGGGHVLVTAPTGTGKTLAAFLGALDRLLSQTGDAGTLRVLYVSPLKALNSDVARNLLTPLRELTARFREAGLSVPDVHVMTRSGDTAEDERRKLRRQPPEILITTPESLNILLTQTSAAALFSGLRAVIVDEIHAVAGSKRGTSLFTALERLALYAGEFQRIGLSATVNPPDLTARALAGFSDVGQPRPVTLVASPASKTYDVRIVVPEFRPDPIPDGKVFWESLALDLRRRVRGVRSTLIFTNSRRSCEKLARLINENQELIAYSHHGSLAKDIRRDVEQRLKDGELKALVATNSLELGIDIGDLDEVVLAQAPRTIASAIQRAGRAGHRTGQVSRARLYPSHGLDVVEAAVIARCVRAQTVEPLVIPEGPLDVLAQVLLSQLCARSSTADELFSLVRRSWPYRDLGRQAFDLVMEMLAGRYAGTRIAELRPRIELGAQGVWSAKASTPFLLYSSGGTIPDRGYFTMRDPSGSALGELDEEFVWERTEGERFALGAQVWKIVSITDQAVVVEPSGEPPHIIPFWRAEDQDRAWFLAEKIGTFLEEAEHALSSDVDTWKSGLTQNEGFSPEAADMLISTLTRQKEACGALPHRWRVVVERVDEKAASGSEPAARQYIVHTFWGARINRPWAYALAQAWEDRYGYALETYPGDDQVLFLVPPEAEIDEVLAQVTPENLEGLLRRRVEATGYFGARFREGAGRALLLPRAGFSKRTPLWQTRMKSKRLFEAVADFPEFPVLVEAWRQCLRDEFDLEELKARLDEWTSGRLAVWHCRTTQPSPFTEGLLWRQVSEKMYATDEPPARRRSGADDGLWDQLLASERPVFSRRAIDDWESRWGRTAPGYAPETPSDLADLLEVRIALSQEEWSRLLDACARDSGKPLAEWESAVAIIRESRRVGVAAMAALWSTPEPLWLRWLEGRGPEDLAFMAAFWNVEPGALQSWVERETKAGTVVTGTFTDDATGPQVCLARTWEQLVRRGRLERRAAAPTQPAAKLPLFLARWQGLVPTSRQGLQDAVGRLLGLPLPAGLWESAVLPARIQPYRAADFDRLFIEEGLQWFGAGTETVVLGFPEDRAAFSTVDADASAQAAELFAGSAEASLTELSRSGHALSELTRMLWRLAWSGAVSATTFGPLRQGIRSDFQFELSDAAPGKRDRGGFQRWASARSSGGTWKRWLAAAPLPPVEALEDVKRRARLVLDRYGIVFRALLTREGPAFQWRELFPAFRLMELSGEIAGGVFWDGVPGLQFATPEALRRLEDTGSELWVQHAQDPVSLCGLGLDAFAALPKRVSGTWLWWRGHELAGVLSSSGKKLELNLTLDDAELKTLIQRSAELLLPEGRSQWTLETLGGVPAAEHDDAPRLREAGFREHGTKLIYWRS